MSAEMAVELQQQAWTLQAEGHLAEALAAAEEALRLMEQADGGDSPDVANLLNDLAEIQIDRQQFPDALALAQRASAMESRLEVPAQIRSKTCELLGELDRTLGNYPRAETSLKAALALSESPEQEARARNNLGVLYKYWGRFDEGQDLYRQALETMIALHGADSLEAGAIYHNIGGILHARGDYQAAEEPGRRAWENSRRQLGEDDPRTMLDAAAYAGILLGLERCSEAEAIYRRALRIFAEVYGPEHYEIAANLHGLAAVMAARGELDEAERHYRRALEIKTRLLGPDNPDVALTRHNLEHVLRLAEPGRRAPRDTRG